MDTKEEEEENPIFYIDIGPNSSYTDYRKIVKQINSGNINSNGCLHHTPDKMKVQLKLHQQRLLYEMIQKEKLEYRTSSGINMCVISDKVGAGKSISILALISNSKQVNNNINYMNRFNIRPTSYGFYGFDYKNANIIDTNLIVVPHGIYSQWTEYIEKSTKLTYYGVSTINDLKKMKKDKLSDCDIVLVKSTKYSDFMKNIYEDNQLEIITTDFKSEFFNEDDSSIDYSLKSALYEGYHSFTSQTFGEKFFNNLKNIREKLNSIDFKKVEERLNIIGDYMISNVRKIKGPIFQRVIIDEANSIKIPNCPSAYGKFNWFITSSVNELLWPTGKKEWNNQTNTYEIISKGISGYGFIKSVFNDNCNQYISNFTQRNFLKNNDKFIEESFNLPDPIFLKIECYTPNELKILHDVGLPEVINALNAGDKNTALKLIGCNIEDEENIVEKILHKLNKELDEKKQKIEDKKLIIHTLQIEIDSFNIMFATDAKLQELESLKSKKYSSKKSLEHFEEQKKSLESKIESLKERITNCKDKECPVCSDKVNTPVLTPCCKNIFCLECLTMSLEYNKEKCPLCRKNLKLSQITYISDNLEGNKNKEEEEKLPTKVESLINIIKNKPDGKFLVFSEYDNSFLDLINEINNNNITHSNICGSGGQIKNIINKYKSGQIKVLFLNAKHYGSGMNLQMSTDIIIYHKMTKDLEMQVIGRGQRLGRECPLTVHHLCYENELMN